MNEELRLRLLFAAIALLIVAAGVGSVLAIQRLV